MSVTDLDRVLDGSFLADLAEVPVGDLRARRATAQAVESHLSYGRRLVQGRLDIVRAELDRRSQPGSGADLDGLVASLPKILADRPRTTGPSRLPTNLVPPEGDEVLMAEIDGVAGPEVMGRVTELPDDRLADVAEGLEGLESRLSADRRRVFDVIDAIQDELVRRYSSGEATPTQILNRP